MGCSPRRRPFPSKDNRARNTLQPGSASLYSRAQISEMARLRRKGAINDADWARWEYELVAAGREGRVVAALDPVAGIPVTR